MVIYELKTSMFEGFNIGQKIYPHNNGQQYGKLYALPGDNCIHKDVIERIPEYFERISDETELDKFVMLYKRAKDLRYI